MKIHLCKTPVCEWRLSVILALSTPTARAEQLDGQVEDTSITENQHDQPAGKQGRAVGEQGKERFESLATRREKTARRRVVFKV